MKAIKTIAITTVIIAISLASPVRSQAQASTNRNLAEQIFDTMIQVHGTQPGYRPVHAKGIVCEGTFTPSKDAAALSTAAHFHANSVPITVRFSDGAPNPGVQDGSPDADPRGMAIRFMLPNGKGTDIVAMSHNGFVVSTGEEFLALQKSIVATDPSKPHPWPVEIFLGSHPAALKFVQDNTTTPVSFGTQTFFGNDAFIFVNKSGAKQAIRYQILPVAGQHDLAPDDAKAKPANFLIDELKTHLAKEPIKFHLIAQLPNPGDPTADPSIVWPPDRKTVDLGTITITSVPADNDLPGKSTAFDPAKLTDGIELSDDSFPGLRSSVYALTAEHRRSQ